MDKIADKSVDCIITDLPYEQTHNDWDEIIPFKHLWEQYKRIIKDNGAIILFGNGRGVLPTVLNMLTLFLEKVSNLTIQNWW